MLAERWRVHYNTVRPHSSLGYRPPAPQAWQHELKPGYGEVESKLRFPLPPHPRRRQDIYKTRCVTVTIPLVQNIGQAISQVQLPPLLRGQSSSRSTMSSDPVAHHRMSRKLEAKTAKKIRSGIDKG